MPIKNNSINESQPVVVEEVSSYTPELEDMKFFEENGKKYAVDLTGELDDHSDLSLYEVNEDGSVGKELLSMFSSGGHCGVTLNANGDAEDVPGLSFEDLTNFVAILHKVYKDAPLKFLYI